MPCMWSASTHISACLPACPSLSCRRLGALHVVSVAAVAGFLYTTTVVVTRGVQVRTAWLHRGGGASGVPACLPGVYVCRVGVGGVGWGGLQVWGHRESLTHRAWASGVHAHLYI